MKRITYLAPVSQLLSQNNTSMRLILPILVVLFSGYSLTLSAQTVVDFTTMTDANTFGTHSQIEVTTGVFAMWGGAISSATVGGTQYKVVSYDSPFIFCPGPVPLDAGFGAGRAQLFNDVLSAPGSPGTVTYTYELYSVMDFDLDGVVSYDGNFFFDPGPIPTSAGRAWLLNQVLLHPASTGTPTFSFKEQLP